MTTTGERFTLTFGKQTFKGGTDVVTALGLPIGHAVLWKEKTAIKDVFTRVGSLPKQLASSDGFLDHGVWYGSQYAVPAGDGNGAGIIVLSTTRRASGGLVASSALHILPHQNAPHIVVNARLSSWRLSVMGEQVNVFRGRGFVVLPDRLAEMGIEVSEKERSFWMDEGEVAEEFHYETINGQGDATAIPELFHVTRSDGVTQTVVTAPAPVRRIKIRD